jgi:hypothetical protein
VRARKYWRIYIAIPGGVLVDRGYGASDGLRLSSGAKQEFRALDLASSELRLAPTALERSFVRRRSAEALSKIAQMRLSLRHKAPTFSQPP